MYEISVIGPTLTGKNILCVYPDAHINLFTYYPDYDRRKNRNPNVEIYSATPWNLALVLFPLACIYSILNRLRLPTSFLNRNEGISALLGSDLVIDMGGITFVDGRELYLPFNVLCIMTPLLLNRKVMKYSQAMGPFNNRLNRFLAGRILPRLEVIAARGEVTEQNLRTLGLDNVVLAADGVFSMRPHEHARVKDYLRKDFTKKKVIGISPSSVIEAHHDYDGIDYSMIMARFIDHLIEERGFNVLIVPHSIRRYTLERKNNDLPVSRKIHDLVDDKRACILIADDLSAEELRVIITSCDLFVASRFHAMVSSLSEGVPTLVCGWSHKYEEVLRMFGLEGYAFDHEHLSVDEMISRFDDLLEDEAAVRARLKERLPEVVVSSRRNFSLIKNLLEA
jgi:polysaccharide pyruvyl transferase WcaK-like protein